MFVGKNDKMELHARRITADIDGKHYELMSVKDAAEHLGISQVKVKSLMFGTKLKPSKLNWVTVPDLVSRVQYGNLRIVLDADFHEVAQEIAKKHLGSTPLLIIDKNSFDY